MGTEKQLEKEELNRFKVYKDEKEDRWVIEDSETPIKMAFVEGDISTEGFWVDFRDGETIPSTRTIGQVTRDMAEYLEENYSHLLHGKSKK